MFLCTFVLKVTQSAFSCSKTKNTKKFSKLTIMILERSQLIHFNFFIINFELMSCFAPMFLLLTFNG